MSEAWFSPGEIRFTRRQVLWLIRNLESLKNGFWPPDASSYIDIPGKKTGKRKAPFETPIDAYAEITDRLEKCGVDGLILLAMKCWEEREESLAKYLKMPEWSIRKRRKSALGYAASGPARRWHDIHDKKGNLKRPGKTYKEFKEREK